MSIDNVQLAIDEAGMIADMPVDLVFGGKSINGCKSVLADTEIAAGTAFSGFIEAWRRKRKARKT